MFPPTSRYAGIETATTVAPDGREVVYLLRRLPPDPATLTVIAEHPVVQGDRLDNVTARYLRDPEQFWRVADANAAMNPNDLTATLGRRLRIATPQAG
jgi:hypothetical protein